MLLITHIILALASIAFTTLSYVFPSQIKIRIGYIVASMTLLTGTVLIAANPSHLIPACVSGVIYLGVVMYGISLTKRKFARETIVN